MKVIECKEIITEKRNKIQEIIDLAKTEIRDLTEAEQQEIDALRQQIEDKKEEIKALQDELDKQVPKDEEDPKDDKEENKRNKNINVNTMKNLSLVKEIRQAIDENKKSITIPAETRAVTVSNAGEAVVETEIQGILEPLYANSVITKLGARWYTGLPHGDVQIPVMSGSNVGWEGETDEADSTGNSFSTVKLQPKRLSAYVDISKMLIAEDTIGVEAAIRRDIVNALNAKLEATIFGNAAGTTEKPAGLLYNAVETNIDDYTDLCNFEAAVENNNVYGEMKYVLNPSAKATLRSMVKGENANAGFVYYDRSVDGVEAYVTTNVPSKKLIYGDFSNLVIGSWGDIELTIDPYTQATKGCIRLVINAYFDFKKAREVAFNYGNVD